MGEMLGGDGAHPGHETDVGPATDAGEVRSSNANTKGVEDQPRQQQPTRAAVQRQLEPKDNIFAQPEARKDPQPSPSSSSSDDGDDDDEKLCSTTTERKNRSACIDDECSGDRTSLCAKRCRYVHCVSSPAEREGNGCNTIRELTCKVDCFVTEKCDDKKNEDKAEACRSDCRQECCDDSDDDEETKDDNDDDKPDKEAKEDNGDKDAEGKEENGVAGIRGGAESEVGSAEPSTAGAGGGGATSDIGPKPNAAASQGNDGIVQGAGAIAVVVDDEGTGDATANDGGGGEEGQQHEDGHHEENDHDDDPPPTATAPAPAPATAIDGNKNGNDFNVNLSTDDGDNVIEQRDGEYAPVDFVFNLPVADEDITAEDILTGANGNTVLEDVEGGLALLLPDLVEDTFGGGGGDERKRKHRMLRNKRKMLVEYADTKPPKITNVYSAGEFASV